MAPKHSNSLPTLVIRHYQKGDLLSKIAAKTLPSPSTVQYMVDKYKLTKRYWSIIWMCSQKRDKSTYST